MERLPKISDFALLTMPCLEGLSSSVCGGVHSSSNSDGQVSEDIWYETKGKPDTGSIIFVETSSVPELKGCCNDAAEQEVSVLAIKSTVEPQ